MKSANGLGNIRKRTKTVNGKKYTFWEGYISSGYGADGKPKRKTFTGATQREVLQKMKEAQKLLDQSVLLDDSNMLLGTWMKIWLEEYAKPSLKELSYDTYKSRINTHITPKIGHQRLRRLSVVMLQQYCNALTNENGLSAKTVISVMAILQEALEKAVELGYMPRNFATYVNRPRNVKKEIKPLTNDEMARFIELCESDSLGEMIKFTLFTGMREGEVCGLAWDYVDMRSGQITICQQLQKRKEAGAQFYLTTAKEDKTRTIIVGSAVKEILRKQMDHQKDQMFRAGMCWLNFSWRLVWCDGEGKPINPQTLNKHVKALGEKIGRDDIHMHSLRHTFAVNSLQEGDDIKTVQSNLGHATAAFTLDVYGHVSDKMKQDSADRMDELIKRLGG